ncbi:hypothetical protein ABIB25_001847 [Nakamurella sp. UYEF19]|uniref:hypothetical protein n=1 Tax=Nakamurella sp. UYEF19 TaxID=1756392 RepID=UPI003391A5C8
MLVAAGIGFTPWHFSPTLVLAAVVTMVSIVVMIVLGHDRKLTSGSLLIGFGLYAAFCAGMLVLD